MKRFALMLIILFLPCSAIYGVTVVGIHGFLVTNRTMVPVVNTLKSNFSVCLFEYRSRQYTIQEIAKDLNQFLCTLAAKKPGEPIYFVTHSIGGVILKHAVNLPNCPQEAKCGRAVLMAPPAQGSALGRSWRGNFISELLMGSKSGRQLLTYTAREMAALGEFPSTMQIFVIAGRRGITPFFNGVPNDVYLAVKETYLNTPHYHRIVPLSHGALIENSGTLDLAKQFLLNGKI